MQVVVLAGGFGTRLRPWTYEIPKPILPMLDKTLVEHVVEAVPNDKVDEVIIAGGYKIDDIEEMAKPASPECVVDEQRMSRTSRNKVVLLLSSGPMKCPSTPKQRAPMRTAGGPESEVRRARRFDP